MKKKLCLGLALITCCMLGLTACGKDNAEPTSVEHNYAQNDIKEKTEDDKQNNETTEPAYTVTTSTPDIDDPWNQQQTDDVAPEVTNYGDVKYVYPTERDPKFYVNDVAVAQTAPYSFTLGDISVSTNAAEELTTISNTKHIYCEGYNMSLDLSDIKYNAQYTDESLAMFVPAIDKFRIGTKDIAVNELIRPIANFEDLIKFCNTNYTCRQPGDIKDIFSLASEVRSNEIWGTTYVWKFSLNEASLEYTQDELNAINKKLNYTETAEDEDGNVETSEISEDINSDLIVEGAYNSNGELSYYTIKIAKKAHFWTAEIMVDRAYDVGTGEYETIPVDEDGNQIPLNELDQYDEDEIHYIEREIMEQQIVKEPSGEYMTQQNGFDFTYANVKLKDGSYIGLDNFSITIHNKDLTSNSKLDIDYIPE